LRPIGLPDLSFGCNGRFLYVIYNAAASKRFAHDVRGRTVTAEENHRDRVCAGWLELSRVDSRVYEKCAAITLRVIDGQQPNVHAVNHAALLRNKQYRRWDAPKL
jgi:hypothetical protein